MPSYMVTISSICHSCLYFFLALGVHPHSCSNLGNDKGPDRTWAYHYGKCSSFSCSSSSCNCILYGWLPQGLSSALILLEWLLQTHRSCSRNIDRRPAGMQCLVCGRYSKAGGTGLPCNYNAWTPHQYRWPSIRHFHCLQQSLVGGFDHRPFYRPLLSACSQVMGLATKQLQQQKARLLPKRHPQLWTLLPCYAEVLGFQDGDELGCWCPSWRLLYQLAEEEVTHSRTGYGGSLKQLAKVKRFTLAVPDLPGHYTQIARFLDVFCWLKLFSTQPCLNSYLELLWPDS